MSLLHSVTLSKTLYHIIHKELDLSLIGIIHTVADTTVQVGNQNIPSKIMILSAKITYIKTHQPSGNKNSMAVTEWLHYELVKSETGCQFTLEVRSRGSGTWP